MFLEAYYRYLIDNNLIEGGEASSFFVGCPAGWSAREREGYEKLLKEAGIPLLSVVPESRAAFMHAKETHKLTTNELKASVLIIDIGSSTTDLTLVKDFRETPLDFGNPSLGAALIDHAIFARTLVSHPEKALLEAAIELEPHRRARCVLRCRRAKEAYFSSQDFYDENPELQGGVGPLPLDIIAGKKLVFEPVVNGLIMQEILHQPLSELGNKSWMGAFHDVLNEAKEKLTQEGLTPDILLLTGGGSNMKFTRQNCQEVFPNTRVRPDSEPELCIARGLARVGRWDLRAAAFKEEIDKLCESEYLEEVVKRHLPGLIERLIDPLVDGLVENAIKPSLYQWRDGHIRTLADLEPRAAALAKAWLGSTDAREKIQVQCLPWLDSIQTDLAHDIDRICQIYKIPTGMLRIDVAADFSRTSPEKIHVDFDPVMVDSVLGPLAAGVVAVVTATLLGGEEIAFLMAGPIGWVIGLLIGIGIGVAVLWLGKEKAKDAVNALDVPHWARRMVLWDSRIQSQCETLKPQLQQTIRQQLTQARYAFDELTEKVRKLLKEALYAKAEETLILIR